MPCDDFSRVFLCVSVFVSVRVSVSVFKRFDTEVVLVATHHRGRHFSLLFHLPLKLGTSTNKLPFKKCLGTSRTNWKLDEHVEAHLFLFLLRCKRPRMEVLAFPIPLALQVRHGQM